MRSRIQDRLAALVLALLAAAIAQPVLADKRVALVIGNSAYVHSSALENPRNDASDLTVKLKRLGFVVVEGYDLDKPGMDRMVRDFARALNGADVGLFFYAGHALQVGGQNYLVPIDARLEDASGLDFETVRLDLIQRTMEREAKTNVLFLDACRDNPLSRNLARAMGTRSVSIGKGLAAVESGVGTLISYSTQPGNVALDGAGRNSPFSEALVRHIDRPGDDLSTVLIHVRNDVMTATRERQIPWEHSSLRAKVYFAPPSDAPGAGSAAAAAVPVAALSPPPLPSPPSRPSAYEQQAELAFWATVKDSRDPKVIQTYLDRFPSGTFAGLARVMIEQLESEARMAALPRPVAPSPGVGALGLLSPPAAPAPAAAAPIPYVDPERLARELQTELKRVGCDPGRIDGRWGDKARVALAEFVRATRATVRTDEPSVEALALARERGGRVCLAALPECDDDETLVNGRCVAKPKPAARKPSCDDDEVLVNGRCVAKRRPAGKTTTAERAAPRREAPSVQQRSSSGGSSGGGGKKCWNPSGGAADTFVACEGAGSGMGRVN